MLKIILLPISLFFIFAKFIKVKILNWGVGETFVGYVLLKVKFIDFTKLYLASLPSNYIIITGTNGKTSTTALLNHILTSQSYRVLTNKSGSNLERGVLSALVLNLTNYFFKNPDFVVLEVDEASVSKIVSKLTKKTLNLSVIVLNLSRDQLDRYGEVDLLAKNIQGSLRQFPKYLIYSKKSKYSKFFIKPKIVGKQENIKLINKLKLTDKNLISNLDFVTAVLQDLKININNSLVTDFVPVKGRGRVFLLNNVSYTINLTKNPASFNTNLRNISTAKDRNILVYVNDNIPDGRDVSWFYDINYILIKKIFEKNNVFVCGSRGFDFYNFLNLIEVSNFNFNSFENAQKYFEKTDSHDVTVLSNYSATQDLVKFFNRNV